MRSRPLVFPDAETIGKVPVGVAHLPFTDLDHEEIGDTGQRTRAPLLPPGIAFLPEHVMNSARFPVINRYMFVPGFWENMFRGCPG